MNTLRIPLTRGKSTIIDAADEPLVAGYHWTAFRSSAGIWYAKAHITAEGRDTTLLLHRHLLQPLPGIDVHHVNDDGLDNRRRNLMAVTRSQNLARARRDPGVYSTLRGVTWDADRKAWKAQITHSGRHINLGRFEDPWQAARAYDQAARALHGPCARCNSIPD